MRFVSELMQKKKKKQLLSQLLLFFFFEYLAEATIATKAVLCPLI